MRHDNEVHAPVLSRTGRADTPGGPMTKAYSYLRFSRPEPRQGDGEHRHTVVAQEYAKHHGLELDDKLTFHDLGVSAYHGKNAKVGALSAFLEAVKIKLVEPGSYLLVENLDRISREGWWDALPTLQAI